MIFVKALFTAAILALPSITNVVAASCYNTNQRCAAGCFDADERVYEGGIRHCVAVGVGWYSPSNSNDRFPCEVGQYSDDPEASVCQLCPPGTFSGGYISTSCDWCPTGFYQKQYGQYRCLSCNPLYYNGIGSNTIDNDEYCAFVGGDSPSQSPSDSPSTFPSVHPSPSPSRRPTVISTGAGAGTVTVTIGKSSPSLSPTRSPSVLRQDMVPSSLPLMVLSTIKPAENSSLEQFELTFDSPSSSPSMIPGKPNRRVVKVIFGLASIIIALIVAAGCVNYLFLKSQRTKDESDKETVLTDAPVLIRIGGEFNHGNQMLDSHLETREDREFNDAMADIEAAMVADDWSVDDDLVSKKGSSKEGKDEVVFAQVISVEYVDDMKANAKKYGK